MNRHLYALGEFEELVILTVGVLYGSAYGVTIKQELEKRLQRGVSVGALQSALRRLEKKGFLRSEYGDASEQRGGRRRCYFFITVYGKRAMEHALNMRLGLWKDIPDIALKF